MKLHHDPHPWDDLWRSVFVEHPVSRTRGGTSGNLNPLMHKIEVPVYLGCDWQNVPLHLPGDVSVRSMRSPNSPEVRVAMLGEYGLTWPWESLHVEALAWFDHWLKGEDTGILEGPAFRYVLPGTEGWHTAETWPLPNTTFREFALVADGTLAEDEADAGSRQYMTLGNGLDRAQASPTDPPSWLNWTSAPLPGRPRRRRRRPSSAWTPQPRRRTPPGSSPFRTSTPQGPRRGHGRLSAGKPAQGRRGRKPAGWPPCFPCRTAVAVPIGEVVPLPRPAGVERATVRRRTPDPARPDERRRRPRRDGVPAIMNFRHASVGTSSLNTVLSSSRLLLPTTNQRMKDRWPLVGGLGQPQEALRNSTLKRGVKVNVVGRMAAIWSTR